MQTKRLKKIPKMELDTSGILDRADSQRDLVTYPSEMNGIGYVTDCYDALVVTTKGGYLRISALLIPRLIEELEWIAEDIDRRKRN